ncbi:MAG TPA: hypothetical protein VK705_08220 [Ferruginibacter sp.]|nr:hypothetical protein [Ferruginibacter sp.]
MTFSRFLSLAKKIIVSILIFLVPVLLLTLCTWLIQRWFSK